MASMALAVTLLFYGLLSFGLSLGVCKLCGGEMWHALRYGSCDTFLAKGGTWVRHSAICIAVLPPFAQQYAPTRTAIL